MIQDIRYILIIDILVFQVNISNKIPAFWHQLLSENIYFILVIIKLTLVIIKQEMNIIIKNLYLKLLANNITFSILKKFFLKKIESNIKINISFFYFLIKKLSIIKKVNTINSDKNIFTTMFLVEKYRKDYQF